MKHIIVSSNVTKSLRFSHLIIIIAKTIFRFKEILTYILMSKINKNQMSKSEFKKLEGQVEKYITKMYNEGNPFLYGKVNHYYLKNTKDGVEFNTHLFALSKLIKEDEIFKNAFNFKYNFPESKKEQSNNIKKFTTNYINEWFEGYTNNTKGDYFMRKVKNGINFYCNNDELSEKLSLDKGFPNHLFNKVTYSIPISNDYDEGEIQEENYIDVVKQPKIQEEKIVEIPEEKDINPYTPWSKEWEDFESKLCKKALQNAKIIEFSNLDDVLDVLKKKPIKKFKGQVKVKDFYN
jgi:hypothetical protein